ncbi:Insulin gene enhancer protein ISL-2 [Fukomys damarensis]|uniref:Insulin gene enhancer protein ISL-2 n=1 Tax=Fukomys damarensis TaxID=885580 RepID=A0A091E5E6_FUKDA|nr:Insulin gene enhancer protein ISL-2 [Fukomys damarensis]
MCVGCGSQIHDQFILRVSPDLEWHAACLKCAECSQYLDETCTCFVRDGKTYCKRDYARPWYPQSPGDPAPGRQPAPRPHVHKQAEKTTRVRTVLNEKQLHTLRTCYAANPRPDALMKEQLVEMTGLSPRVIRVWFQNKRCKDKKKSILMKQLQQQQHSDKTAMSGPKEQGYPRAPERMLGLALPGGLATLLSGCAPAGLGTLAGQAAFSSPLAQSKSRLGLGSRPPGAEEDSRSPLPQSLQGLTGTPLVAGSPIRHDSAVQGSAVEVQTFQPPWKALSEFALQSDLDQPAFQQLVSFSESGSLGNSSGSDVTSLSSQLPDTPNSMVPSPVET